MHSMSSKVRFTCTVFFGGLLALPAMAAEGRIPIPFTSPPSTPITITAPGRYILTRPLRATAAGNVINVAVGFGAGLSEVDIDLNGFTIDATPFAGAVGINLTPVAGSNVEVAIRNGAIQGGTTGIQALGSSGRKVVIENMRIGGTASNAISIADTQNIVICNNIIVDAGVGFAGPAAGILIQATPASIVKQATIEGNLIKNTKDGINILGIAPAPVTVAILNNRLETIASGGSTGDAISLQFALGSLVMENTIREVFSGSGIRLVSSNACKLFDNVIDRVGGAFPTGHGISLDAASNDSLILRNVVREAAQSGLYIAGDRNQIESNLLNTNGRGLTLDLPGGATANLYRANTARGNGGGAVCPAVVCSVDFCGFALASNQTQGDNWMPATAAAPPACEK